MSSKNINNSDNTHEDVKSTENTLIKNNSQDKCKPKFDENSFVGNMIKKIKEGLMNDDFKNEFVLPVYEEVYLHIYPHYIIFFALLLAIIVLEILIFFEAVVVLSPPTK